MSNAQTWASRRARFVGGYASYRDFSLLVGGQLVSSIGTQMQVVAVAWQIYAVTNSKIALGLIGLARGLPLIGASLFAGVFADAFNRKKLLFVTQTTMASMSAVMAILTITGEIVPWQIYVMIGAISAAQAVDNPARTAMVPNLVPPEALPRAWAFLVALREFAVIAGPFFGGIVIAVAGVAPNYIVDCISYGAVLLAVLMLRTPMAQQPIGSVSRAAIREGWTFIIHNRIILAIQSLDFFANFFAASTVLFPIFAANVYRTGPVGLGFLYGAGSAGAVIGALCLGTMGRVRRPGITILISIFVYGLAIAVFGWTPWFVAGLGFLALSGAADSMSASLRGTIAQLLTPDQLRGRVSAANMIFVAGGPQLGNVEAGVLASAIGVQATVAIGGLATAILVGVTALFVPEIRRYRWADDPIHETPQVVAAE